MQSLKLYLKIKIKIQNQVIVQFLIHITTIFPPNYEASHTNLSFRRLSYYTINQRKFFSSSFAWSEDA